jgi:putative DNA-invertase from lambdoid prophage Rac
LTISAERTSAYLGRKPSYDRDTFERITELLASSTPPSLGAIARAEGLTKQTVYRLKKEPQVALAELDSWGM